MNYFINKFYKKAADFRPRASVIDVAINILGFFNKALEILTLCNTSYLSLAANNWFNLLVDVSSPYSSGIDNLFHTLVFFNT